MTKKTSEKGTGNNGQATGCHHGGRAKEDRKKQGGNGGQRTDNSGQTAEHGREQTEERAEMAEGFEEGVAELRESRWREIAERTEERALAVLADPEADLWALSSLLRAVRDFGHLELEARKVDLLEFKAQAVEQDRQAKIAEKQKKEGEKEPELTPLEKANRITAIFGMAGFETQEELDAFKRERAERDRLEEPEMIRQAEERFARERAFDARWKKMTSAEKEHWLAGPRERTEAPEIADCGSGKAAAEGEG